MSTRHKNLRAMIEESYYDENDDYGDEYGQEDYPKTGGDYGDEDEYGEEVKKQPAKKKKKAKSMQLSCHNDACIETPQVDDKAVQDIVNQFNNFFTIE